MIRIDCRRLTRPLTVTLSGDEPELLDIYQALPSRKPEEKLEASLVIEPQEKWGTFALSGSIKMTVTLPCSRCDAPVVWPLSSEITCIFRKERAAELRRDHPLSRDELDEYFHDGKALDLFELLNDVVQTALPIRTVRTSADGPGCSLCADWGENSLVFAAKKYEDSFLMVRPDREGRAH